MSKTLTAKVDFSLIRYANCWEDAEVLLEGLSPEPGSKILSIGSAGDNSFSLLVSNPELVISVDISATQLCLIELKKVCFRKLEYEEVLKFLGFQHCDKREETFQKLKNELPVDAKTYWEAHSGYLRTGIIYQGKFEKYFGLFSKRLLPLIHNRATVDALFAEKSTRDQEQFYKEKWNTWRWRLLFKIFFSKYIMGKYGRDPEFFNQVNLPVGEYIYRKAEQHLTQEYAQSNFMLYFNLNGHFGDLLPHYLRKENFSIIRSNLDCLKTQKAFAQDINKTFGNFQYMNLSNIFEYMDESTFRYTSQELIKGMDKGGKFAYWNLMVPRRISSILPEQATFRENLSNRLTLKDKGFFYSKFIVDEVIC